MVIHESPGSHRASWSSHTSPRLTQKLGLVLREKNLAKALEMLRSCSWVETVGEDGSCATDITDPAKAVRVAYALQVKGLITGTYADAIMNSAAGAERDGGGVIRIVVPSDQSEALSRLLKEAPPQKPSGWVEIASQPSFSPTQAML